MKRLVAGVTGGAIALATVVLVVVAHLLDRTNVAVGAASPTAYGYMTLLLGVAVVGAPVVGAVIVAKRPNTRVGWLLLAIGAGLALSLTSNQYAVNVWHHEPGASRAVWAMWVANTAHWSLALSPFVLVLFPHDRAPSSGWRRAMWVGAAALILVVWVDATAAGIERLPGADNPLGSVRWIDPWWVSAVALTIFLAFTIGALIGTVARYRRARGLERAQMKWLAVTAGASLLIVPVLFVGSLVFGVVIVATHPGQLFVGAMVALCFNGLAIAIGRAVLRYRLFEIDRIVSRVVAYAVVVGSLVAVYTALVVTLQAMLNPLRSGGDLAVAASTLGVAALFRPLLAHVRRGVDRRFNRTRHDAQRIVEEFGQRLRDEVDLAVLRTDLLDVVGEAVRPRLVGLWAPPVPEAGPRYGYEMSGVSDVGR